MINAIQAPILFNQWTMMEEKRYVPRPYAALQEAYGRHDLRSPHEKARFLAEEVLNISPANDILNNPRLIAMNQLEKMAIDLHRRGEITFP